MTSRGPGVALRHPRDGKIYTPHFWRWKPAGYPLEMPCPLCQKRPAKRACPALRQSICPTCCATKRLVEIACPHDCPFLEAAQRHPAAAVKRQIDQDVGMLMATLGPISERQLQLFFILQTMVLRHKPGSLVRLVDADLAQAAAALATTLETASKGVIYDESASSPVAEGLRRELRPTIHEIVKSGGSRAEQEVAALLRGIERGARHENVPMSDSPTSYLDLLTRVLRHMPPVAPPEPSSRLIVTP